MAEIASAFVSLLPSAKGFGRKLESEVNGEVKSSGSKLGAGFGKAFAAGGALVAAAGVGSFLKGAIDEGREAQKVTALTNAVIKSTGGIANVTAKDVDRLATSISLKTGVDDEAIAAGQNMLLTFGNVRNEVGKGNDIFSQATVAATDMAAAFGGDAVSNSKMLGKALNDPTKGVSALTRVGVSFTEQQKEQIKTLQASGDTLGAQKIILGELSKQTAGAAKSQATAGDKFRTAFANLQESVGTALLPLFDKLLNGLSRFVIFLTNDIGPGLAALNGYIAPVIASVQAFVASLFAGGGGGLGGALQTIGATITSNFLPVLQTMANTFTTKILPAVTAVVQYVVSALVPIFQQVAGILTGQVIPIIAKLATFFYGTLYPAVIQIVGVVASNLKPVFDQLVATIQARVVPTVRNLLVKFEQYRPALQKIVMAVVLVVGKLLAFAAAVLGKVLPVVIRLAGFLLQNVVGAIVAVVGALIKIIAKVVDFGRALVNGVKDAAKFATGVVNKGAEIVSWFNQLPGKIMGVLSGLASKMYNAGVQLMVQLAKGITDKIGDAINAAKAGLDKLKGLLPGSPIKWGPLKNWNNGGAGKRLMGMVADGIEKGTPKTLKAAQSAFGKISDALESERDNLRSTLDTLKGDFQSLADSVSSAFAGNLFEATTGGDFFSNLMGKRGELQGLLASFKTLQGWGLDPAFLSQLFASGNGGLITELAGMGQAGASQAGALFGEVTSLSNQLGNAVAKYDPVADRIDVTNQKLDLVIKQLGFLGGDIGHELNQAVSKGQRDKRNQGKKGK